MANRFVELFHTSLWEDQKKKIVENFSKKDSILRIVIATVALGMGVNFPDVDIVVHVGCPQSCLTYWQEVGRCARDGRPGYALCLLDNNTKSQKNTKEDMRNIANKASIACIRRTVLQNFVVQGVDSKELEQLDEDEGLCLGCQSSNTDHCCTYCCKYVQFDNFLWA